MKDLDINLSHQHRKKTVTCYMETSGPGKSPKANPVSLLNDTLTSSEQMHKLKKGLF